MWGSLATHLRFALIIVLVVVIIILLSKWTGTGSNTLVVAKGSSSSTGKSRLSTDVNADALQQLAKESRDWGAEASKDDTSPVGQLINATYALAYAQAVQSLAAPAEVKKATGLDVEPFIASMKAKQTESVQFLAHNFPSIL